MKLRNRNHVPCSNTSVRKFWRTRNACGRASVSTPKLNFMSVFITRYKDKEHVFYFLEHEVRKKRKQLVYLVHQNVNSLCSRNRYVKTSCQVCFPIEFNNETILNQSESVFSLGYFLNMIYYVNALVKDLEKCVQVVRAA